MSYKIIDHSSLKCQGHGRSEKTKKLSQSIGDQGDIIMWNPGLDLKTEKKMLTEKLVKYK